MYNEIRSTLAIWNGRRHKQRRRRQEETHFTPKELRVPLNQMQCAIRRYTKGAGLCIGCCRANSGVSADLSAETTECVTQKGQVGPPYRGPNCQISAEKSKAAQSGSTECDRERIDTQILGLSCVPCKSISQIKHELNVSLGAMDAPLPQILYDIPANSTKLPFGISTEVVSLNMLKQTADSIQRAISTQIVFQDNITIHKLLWNSEGHKALITTSGGE